MKKIILSLIGALILLVMALPAGLPAVMGQAGLNQTATNETATNQTATDESSLVDESVSDVSGCVPCGGGNNRTGTGSSTFGTNGESDGDMGLLETTSNGWPRCQSGCTAHDASITRIWLVANPACTPGTPTSAELWATFDINRSQGVCCVVSVVDIYIDGNLLQADYVTNIGDLVPGGTTYDIKITDITWPCGSVLTLSNIYAQWDPKTGQPCPTCTEDCTLYGVPSKCYYDPGPYEVAAPLIANFEFQNVCYCNNTQFTDTTTGGVEPYTYSWDLGHAGAASTDPNPTYKYPAGTYNVTLTVTDHEGTVDSQS